MIPIGHTQIPRQKTYPGYNMISNSLSCYGYPWPPYLPPGTFPPGYGPAGPIPGQDQAPLPAGVVWQPASWEPVPPPDEGVEQPQPFPLQSNPSHRRARRRKWHIRRITDGLYPWMQPTLHVSNYPTPGMFYDASNPNGFVFDNPERLYGAVLGSALSMAERDTSIAGSRRGADLRKKVADDVASGMYNDGLFGTSTVELVGGRRWVGPHGRGINWAPHHGNIRQSIAAANPPKRTTKIDGTRIQEYIEVNNKPLVWIPAYDLDALATHGDLVPLRWANGRSAIDPPPVVSNLGVDLSGVRFPGGVGFGEQNPHRGHRGSARQWWESQGT
jgi:hypothetical protein